MLHLRQPTSSGIIFSCTSGEGQCVTDVQLFSHLAHITVSLESHFLDKLILNDITNTNVFLRATGALVELLKQKRLTFPKFWDEIMEDT